MSDEELPGRGQLVGREAPDPGLDRRRTRSSAVNVISGRAPTVTHPDLGQRLGGGQTRPGQHDDGRPAQVEHRLQAALERARSGSDDWQKATL